MSLEFLLEQILYFQVPSVGHALYEIRLCLNKNKRDKRFDNLL